MIGTVNKERTLSVNMVSVEGNLHVADEIIEGIMKNYEGCIPTAKLKFQINLIIDEIFGNISSYAFKKNDGRVNIVTWIEKNPLRFVVKFIDNGVCFNPLEKDNVDINTSLEERKIGGLGIHIIKNMVDTMEYKYIHGCNALIVTKNLY